MTFVRKFTSDVQRVSDAQRFFPQRIFDVSDKSHVSQALHDCSRKNQNHGQNQYRQAVKDAHRLEHEHLQYVGFARKFTEGAQDVQDAHRIISIAEFQH